MSVIQTSLYTSVLMKGDHEVYRRKYKDERVYMDFDYVPFTVYH